MTYTGSKNGSFCPFTGKGWKSSDGHFSVADIRWIPRGNLFWDMNVGALKKFLAVSLWKRQSWDPACWGHVSLTICSKPWMEWPELVIWVTNKRNWLLHTWNVSWNKSVVQQHVSNITGDFPKQIKTKFMLFFPLLLNAVESKPEMYSTCHLVGNL